jgi:hypothetical protein
MNLIVVIYNMSKTYRVSLTKINKIAKQKTPEVSSISYATDGKHKYVAKVGKRNIKFGAIGYQDYLTHGDKERRKNYIARHSGLNENWNKPSPGRYSKVLLW